MSNPPKQKGTGGETELLRLLEKFGVSVRRREAGARADLRREGSIPTVTALATRPDRGQWLFTIDLPTYARLIRFADEVTQPALDIEVKRYTRFAHHGIFEKKFGR